MSDKKRHHYLPKTYLKYFVNESGMVRVYRKDNPEAQIWGAPDNVGFHKYYYSQPIPEGGQDNNSLEDRFSELESEWPSIVDSLLNFENVNDRLEQLLSFIALQRVRVPAARDAFEKLEAEAVRATIKNLDRQGKLPPKPDQFPDNFIDDIDISIDPHRSIHAMVAVLSGLGSLFDRLGFDAFHNTTPIDFLTSDNPVIWFDPGCSPETLKPYQIEPEGDVLLFFPVTPRIVIIGSSKRQFNFARKGLEHIKTRDCGLVKSVNREVVRFAYDSVFSKVDSAMPLVKKYAGISPVTRVDHLETGNGSFMLSSSVFAEREKKTKWVAGGGN